MPERARVVARFLDGRMLKGYTRHFDPRRPAFEMFEGENESGDPVRVRMQELKAVYFVRDFDGNSTHQERKEFEGPFTGRRLLIEFADGEILVGTTFGYDTDRDGFFIFPADPASNNEKVFVPDAAIKRVTKLPPGIKTA